MLAVRENAFGIMLNISYYYLKLGLHQNQVYLMFMFFNSSAKVCLTFYNTNVMLKVIGTPPHSCQQYIEMNVPSLCLALLLNTVEFLLEFF